jgi:hypothetical protein
MTPTITRCGNGEFLLKLVDYCDGFESPPRTILTLVLTDSEMCDLCEQCEGLFVSQEEFLARAAKGQQ